MSTITTQNGIDTEIENGIPIPPKSDGKNTDPKWKHYKFASLNPGQSFRVLDGSNLRSVALNCAHAGRFLRRTFTCRDKDHAGRPLGYVRVWRTD